MKKISKAAMTKSLEQPIVDRELDKIDRKIVNALQRNNQLTNLELSEMVNISPPPCLRRVRRLRELGIIVQDVSLVDPFKIGQHLIAFINISLEKHHEDSMRRFERAMFKHHEVKQCYFISGEVDYLLIAHVADINAYNEFVRRVLLREHNIKTFRSSFCLTRIKYDTSIMLDET